MSKLLIIDTYGLIFRAYHAYPPLNNSQGLPTNAIFGFTQMLINTIDRIKPDYIVCASESETPTFRHRLYSEYKSNRKEADQELKIQIGHVLEIIQRLNIQLIYLNGFEADDVIGSLTNKYKTQLQKIEIVTGDKDLLQLIDNNVIVIMPGRNFSDMTYYDRFKFKEKFGIEVENYPLYKALTGDTSDNIKGIPGIGPKTAIQIVNRFNDINKLKANLEALDYRIAQNILENQKLLDLYYELSQIRTDLAIKVDLENLKTKKINFNALRKIVQEYEFYSISRKISQFIEHMNDTYSEFSLFEESYEQKYEVKFNLQVKEYKFNNTAEFYVKNVSSEGFWIGDGINFIEINSEEVYNFFILHKPFHVIGFEIKPLIKKLIQQKYKNLDKIGFTDLKIIWYILRNDLAFQDINDLASYLKTSSIVEIYKISLQYLKENKLTNIFELERKIQIILALMEEEGVHCDIKYLEQKEREYQDKIELIKKEMFKLIGHEFNPSSNKELSHILFNVLKLPPVKKGKSYYLTDEKTLNKLEGTHEIISLIKKYRLLSKILNTYILGLKNHIQKDGKIHTTFIQDNIKTGRIGSMNPNLQNLPKPLSDSSDDTLSADVRKAFKVPESFLLLSVDYSQIELRILAHESEDEYLINSFKNNEDIHTATAKLIFNKEQITKTEREQAKTINFAIIYGMEAYGLSQTLGIDIESAQAFIENYFTRLPGVKKYFQRIEDELNNLGYVKTFLGRRRYFNNWAKASKYEKKAILREAINMPIQGGGADVIKIAMIKIHDFIQTNKLKTKLILQIHDELILNVPKEELDFCISNFVVIMEEAYQLKVPLKVNCKTGTNLLFDEYT